MYRQILLVFFSCFFMVIAKGQRTATVRLNPSARIALPEKPNASIDAFCKAQADYKDLNEESKELYYYTNYLRHSPKMFWDSIIAPILNAYPTLVVSEAKSLQEALMKLDSLPLFTLNATLIALAKGHAKDIAQLPSAPSHNSTNGTSFATRMKSAGINRCAGENLSLGMKNIALNLTLLLLDIGLPDMGHRKALLNPRYEQIGVWVTNYGNNQIFLVQDFACK